ncbi:MAG: hypothetical protein AB1651_09015 [Pseudomonadota bacterium]
MNTTLPCGQALPGVVLTQRLHLAAAAALLVLALCSAACEQTPPPGSKTVPDAGLSSTHGQAPATASPCPEGSAPGPAPDPPQTGGTGGCAPAVP